MYASEWAGLKVSSELELKELPHCRGVGGNEEEVVVQWGSVPDRLPDGQVIDARQEIAPGAFLFRRSGIAHYLVTGGKHITVQRELGASDAAIGAFLLGRPFAALGYQRGWFELHGGSVVTGGKAKLLVGPAGAGKSTLLAALEMSGCQLLADDVTVIKPAGGSYQAWPTSQRLRLRPDSLLALKGSGGTYEAVRPGMDKLIVPFARFSDRAAEPTDVYVLERGTSPALAPFGRAEAVTALLENLNRPRLANLIRDPAALLADACALAERVRVCRLAIPDGLGRLDEVTSLLTSHWSQHQ